MTRFVAVSFMGDTYFQLFQILANFWPKYRVSAAKMTSKSHSGSSTRFDIYLYLLFILYICSLFMTSYQYSNVTMHPSIHFHDIAKYWPKIPRVSFMPNLHLMSLLRTQKLRQDVSYEKKTRMMDILGVKQNFDDIFSRFDTAHTHSVTDRQTDIAYTIAYTALA